MNCYTDNTIGEQANRTREDDPSVQSGEGQTSSFATGVLRSSRFFFDFADGNRCVRDSEGTECESAQDARVEAMRALTAIARDDVLQDDLLDYMVSVRDDDGRLIYRATLSLAGEWLSARQ
ncbi:DUF6894 family protein [Methylobacterium durans]|uniref:DUF6894 family protein n=1 Tax=Methylobacterium durans TaxID=2202825 RepID=UPI0013A5ABD0|nr:hypothetical protein [Methylobacterium durans]